MKCNNPKMSKLVRAYSLGLLSKDEIEQVEAHLLSCDACLQEIYALAPVHEMLVEMPAEYWTEFAPRPSRIKKYLIAVRNVFLNPVHALYDFIHNRKLLYVFAPAMTAAIALIIILSLSLPHTVSKFAMLQSYTYTDYNIKSLQNLSAETPFEKAIEYYKTENYEKAVPLFRAQLKIDPESSVAHFYLGVSYLMLDQTHKGIDHIDIAKNYFEYHDQKKMVEACYWYLGNAYLQMEKESKAKGFFKELVEMQGIYEKQAGEQLKRIKLFEK